MAHREVIISQALVSNTHIAEVIAFPLAILPVFPDRKDFFINPQRFRVIPQVDMHIGNIGEVFGGAPFIPDGLIDLQCALIFRKRQIIIPHFFIYQAGVVQIRRQAALIIQFPADRHGFFIVCQGGGIVAFVVIERGNVSQTIPDASPVPQRFQQRQGLPVIIERFIKLAQVKICRTDITHNRGTLIHIVDAHRQGQCLLEFIQGSLKLTLVKILGGLIL